VDSLTDVRAPEGRTLRVHEGGDPHGVAIVVHHGTPSGGLLYPPHVEDAAGRGIRLVGYDRPGYGGSTPHPGRSVADAGADVEALVDALAIERFATYGASGGGPHALACGALLPDRCVAVATIASVGPYDADGLVWLEGMGEGNQREIAAALEGGETFEQFLVEEVESLGGVTADGLAQAMAPHLSAVDAAVLTGDLAAYFVSSFQDATRNGIAGWRDDDYAFLRPWGFELGDIRVPVLLRQGRQDLMVPFAHGAWLAERVPGVEAELSEEHGHLTLHAGVPEVHAWLVEHF
jgi:pimeloyl-ACP methyl ester carboxylesterase